MGKTIFNLNNLRQVPDMLNNFVDLYPIKNQMPIVSWHFFANGFIFHRNITWFFSQLYDWAGVFYSDRNQYNQRV